MMRMPRQPSHARIGNRLAHCLPYRFFSPALLPDCLSRFPSIRCSSGQDMQDPVEGAHDRRVMEGVRINLAH